MSSLQLFIPSAEAISPPRETLPRELFVALINGELEVQLHFQPIVGLHDGTVAGYEALARFPAEFGAPPDVCLAQARFHGLGLELETKLFRQTMASRHHLPHNCFLSINLGADFLLSGMHAALQSHADLTGLVFEITEEAAIADYTAVRQALAKLRQQGAMIAVDDAGSGYASLSHILEIKPEFIKIDRRIVQNCHIDRAKATLIEMLGAAANRMDSWILAEGIECAGELEELVRLGVPLAQGYFLGRPAPEMAGLPEPAKRLLARKLPAPELTYLHGLFCACRGYATLESGTQALQNATGLPVAVVTDRWNRPIQVVHRHPLLGPRLLPGFLRVHLDSEPIEVLQRAMLRAPESRFDPLVLISPEGQLLGFLEIDRLLNSVLGSPFPKGSQAKSGRIAVQVADTVQ